MLIFTKIRWCNFLSTGNSFTEVCLNDSPNVLIIGENGAGKSTILDALCFALFGKAFRNINKPQLLNSVNQKGLITEIEFTINNKNYKVIRGIKPNIFEIWCDGICLNQDSATKDYQEHLEKFILKMTFKSFTQIVILGSASFKPFMQLTPAERRIIIEDLLDIQIFSVMNTIVKQRFIMNRELIEKNRIEHIGKTEKITVIEKTLKGLKQNNENRLKQLQEQYDELEKTKIILFDEISSHEKTLTALIEKTQPLAKRKTKFNEAIKIKTKLITNADRCETNIKFYSNNDICPTCKQNLESHFIENQLTELTTKKTEYTKAISDITKKLDAITSEIELSEKHISEANDIRLHITAKTTQYNNIINQMNNINETIQELKCSDQLTIDNEEELKNAQTEIERIKADRERLVEEKTIIETGIQLLKDGGIKTKIIKQYLPIINKLINKYLSEMGFFVNFNIDENFNETIKSRYRDVFSYQNFSEGEKTRIDLALLFTWRAIARMRNSINTNLLLFDEIFDGSLDANGTDEFLKIMWNFNENANIFVISHKQDVLIDKFKKVYRFKKTKNFSVLV